MRILLDTHILLWALTDDPKLSVKAREYIQDPNNELYYSAVSVWEIQLKHTAHPEAFSFSAKQFADLCEEAGYVGLPIKIPHVFSLDELVWPEDRPVHKDPFDRMLISQAKAENMKLMTHDAQLLHYSDRLLLPV